MYSEIALISVSRKDEYRKNVILSVPQSQSTQNMCYGCTGTTVRKPCVFTLKGFAPS